MDASVRSRISGAATATATAGASQLPAPKSYALSGKIMLSAIASLLAVVLLVLCLHIYSRWYFLRLARRRRLARAFMRRSTAGSGGLDPELVKTLPVFTYSPEQGKDEAAPAPECAVCLCDFEERDQGRVLPPCGHIFHAECIAMWFHSHSTCPLCRAPVKRPAVKKLGPDVSACRCGEEGGKTGTETASSPSTSLSGSSSPESSSSSSMARCLPELDFRTSRAGGVLQRDIDVDLERGEAPVTELNLPTANRNGSKTMSTS